MNNQPSSKGYVANQGKTDYVVNKNPRVDVIAFILSVVAAIILWGYVSVNNTENTVPVVFNSMEVHFAGEQRLKDEYGLIVQSVTADNLSVTLTGKASDVAALEPGSVNVSADLSKISAAGVYSLPLVCESPEGFDAVLSQEFVKVSIDKPDTRVIAVDSGNIQLTGWIKDLGCTIVDQSLNISTVTLEGNTLNLQKVAGVQIRTASIGLVNSSMKVSGEICLLDEQGHDLNLPVSVSTDAGKDGIAVSLTVYKEKILDLKLESLYGYLAPERIRIEPSQVRIYGEASLVSGIDTLALDMESINDKYIMTDKIYQDVALKGTDNLIVTTVDGSPFAGATVTVSVSDLSTRSMRLSGFVLAGAPENMKIAEEYLLVSVRAKDVANAASMLGLISQNPANITLYADYAALREDGTIPVTVFFGNSYSSYVYELGDYFVTLTEVELPVENPDPEPEPEPELEPEEPEETSLSEGEELPGQFVLDPFHHGIIDHTPFPERD